MPPLLQELESKVGLENAESLTGSISAEASVRKSPWGCSRVREKPVWLAAFVSLQPNCTEMFWEHTAAVTHGAGPYLKADRNACLTNPRISAWLQEDVLFLTQADKPLAVYQSTAAICFNKDHLHPRTGGTLNLHGKDNISSLSPKTKSCQVTLCHQQLFNERQWLLEVFGSPVNTRPLLPPNQQLCSPATLCSLVLSAALSICLCWLYPKSTLTPSALCCLCCQAPSSSMASCNPSMDILPPSTPVPHQGGTPGPWHPLLSGTSFQGEVTELTSLYFASVCTFLVLNYPHHLPTKALWQQCLFPIARLAKRGEENHLGLCWWKSGPAFLQPAKPTVTQERQSSSWLHANLIVRF